VPRAITFEIQDEWTIEALYRAFDELRDNLDLGLVRNIEQYVSGWVVRKDNSDVKVIWRKSERIESDSQQFSVVVVWDKRTDCITVTLCATGDDKSINALAKGKKEEVES
jgi:hypothetical protein